ncbi:MAG: glycosyltransferase family 2 protein [Chloroflexota bacterium]
MTIKAANISVVIPTYNREDLIQRAIESALNQSNPPDEIIVVDDGSTDGTRAILEGYGSKIHSIFQENSGSAVARDRGIRSASSEWVALLDSDDFWHLEHLQRMLSAIEQTDGRANYYFADTLHPPDRGVESRWAAVGFEPNAQVNLIEDGSEWALMNPQPMMLQSSVFSRSVYVAAGGFLPELRFRDDTHIFLKLGLNQSICAVCGIGAEMTSDGDPNQRLTLSYSRAKLEMGHHMQVWMFSDLLASLPALHKDAKTEIQRRLVGAHYSLARDSWQQKRFVQMGRRLMQSYFLKLKFSLQTS